MWTGSAAFEMTITTSLSREIPAIFTGICCSLRGKSCDWLRAGITGTKVTAGKLTHRLPLRISQLEKNYDLVDLNAEQLIELLGDEFSCIGSR